MELEDAARDHRRGGLKAVPSGRLLWIGKWAGFGALEHPAVLNHPVYRHLRGRMDALDDLLRRQRAHHLFNPPRDDHNDREQALLLRELQATAPDRWVFVLPGEPNFRAMLGGIFTPPVVRFDDATLPATDGAFAAEWPWPVTGEELATAVADAERRLDSLYRADAAARFGLPRDAFAARPAP